MSSEDEVDLPQGGVIHASRMGLFPWLRSILFGSPSLPQQLPPPPSPLSPPPSPPASAPAKSQETEIAKAQDGRTDIIIFQLALLGVVMLVFLGVQAVTGKVLAPAVTFIVWGTAGAFCAYVFGLLLGLLFGLPSTRGWSARNVVRQNDASGKRTSAVTFTSEEGQGGAPVGGVPSSAGLDDHWKDPDIPYDENTSLEQIADWLTKIIVGIGLTQFHQGRLYFNDLALSLTVQMLGTGQTNPVPGGLLLVGFGCLGFLTAYMWMRRYFISEMVIARRSALRVANAESLERANEIRLRAAQVESKVFRERAERKAEMLHQKLEVYKTLGAVQERPASASDSLQVSAQQLEEIRKRTSAQMRGALDSILASPELDPEDTWKGRFGGQSEASGFGLSGTVSAFEGDPSRFIVDLVVRAPTEGAPGIRSARFFLHPTFNPMTAGVDFGTDGVAPLKMVAYQASTVGVLLENGDHSITKLELSLSSLATAKKYPVFLSR